jgi:hypothetical protein
MLRGGMSLQVLERVACLGLTVTKEKETVSERTLKFLVMGYTVVNTLKWVMEQKKWDTRKKVGEGGSKEGTRKMGIEICCSICTKNKLRRFSVCAHFFGDFITKSDGGHGVP